MRAPSVEDQFEVVAVPVTLASFVNAYLGGPFWPIDPEILTPPPSTLFPFAVPFQISNKSGLFPFANLSITCALDQVGILPNTIIQGSSVTASGWNNIPPNRSEWYICPYQMMLSPYDRVAAAEIHLILKYDTYWPIEHKIFPSIHYTLDASSVPPRWLEGGRMY